MVPGVLAKCEALEKEAARRDSSSRAGRHDGVADHRIAVAIVDVNEDDRTEGQVGAGDGHADEYLMLNQHAEAVVDSYDNRAARGVVGVVERAAGIRVDGLVKSTLESNEIGKCVLDREAGGEGGAV